MDIVGELIRVVETLEHEGVPYAICGGLAVTIHGRPRLTVDIDLVVPRQHIQQAVESVASIGFDVESGWIGLPENGLGSGRLFRVAKVDGEEFLTLDLLEVDSSENPIWKDQQRLPLRGTLANVLSRTALIRMKSASERTKDWLDIELLNDDID